MPGHPMRSRPASPRDRARPHPRARQPGPGPTPSRIVEALDLALVRRTAGMLPGEHRAPGVGAGTELAQLRVYQPGDDVRQLDPAASARTGVPHVRLHVPERLMTAWIVLDVSPSMAFGTGLRLKSDVAGGAAALLARLAVRRGGRAGLLLCGGQRELLIPPRGGRRASAVIEHAIREGVVADGAGDDASLGRALRRLSRLARSPGMVAVVSDFRAERRLGPAAARDRSASLACGRRCERSARGGASERGRASTGGSRVGQADRGGYPGRRVT